MQRLLALAALALLAACHPGPAQQARAQAWPEADVLFHSEPRWLGGDSAYSIDLGSGRVLWLFGDSFIATSDAHLRSQSTMVRNSVAIQTGYDPTSASMAFYWGESGGQPAALFPGSGAEWLWPGHGARVGKKLVLFFMRVKSDPGVLGFLTDGAQALLVDNPDDAPTAWTSHALPLPQNTWGVSVGAGGCTVQGDYLLCYSPVEPGNHDIYLLRFAIADAGAGDLSKPEWYAGKVGWVEGDGLIERPMPVFTGGQTELSVHYDSATRQFIEVQTDGFGGANLDLRTALRAEGGWSELQTFYRPLESNNANTLVYSAKAHPELTPLAGVGGVTAITYCTNHTDFQTLLNDQFLYYPRFVRLSLSGP